MQSKYIVSSFSEKGPRPTNQDSFDFIIDSRHVSACVSDGVGGQSCGEIASNIAVSKFMKGVTSGIKVNFETLVYDIHNKISTTEGECSGMAATLAGCSIVGDKLSGVNVGDSRICVLRGNGIKQLSEDHTEGFKLYKEKRISFKDYKVYPRNHILESALGAKKQVLQIREFVFNLEIGDRVILTTDGVHDVVTKVEFRDASIRNQSDNQMFIDEVGQLVQDRRANDNYTMISIQFLR